MNLHPKSVLRASSVAFLFPGDKAGPFRNCPECLHRGKKHHKNQKTFVDV